MSFTELETEIIYLKSKLDVSILAHNYQMQEIQRVADYIGDSLGLAQIANEEANSKYIIFAGVNFMAETTSILNPDKKILIPHPESKCPMASYLPAEKIIRYKKRFPNLPTVLYVNSTARAKAEADICCTSSNSVIIVDQIAEEYNTNSVLFGPDANLADYVEGRTGIKTIKIPEKGHCVVHSQLKVEDIIQTKERHPSAVILAHPECKKEVLELVDEIGSTSFMYNYVKESPKDNKEFIIGTEKGLVDRMKNDFPNKQFYLPSSKMVCYNMKKHNLELIIYLLKNPEDKSFEVKVPKNVAKKARISINRMLKYS